MSITAVASSHDVFLCHNSREKDAVRIINAILRQEYGLDTYLDEATLVGGEAWEQAIQGALARARACAVIVGGDRLGLEKRRTPQGVPGRANRRSDRRASHE